MSTTDIPAEFDLAAKREGWAIFDCDGSDDGRYQVCRIDDPEAWVESLGFLPPQLNEDDEAWRIVMTGTLPHHEHARSFIHDNNWPEWKRMVAFSRGIQA